MELLRRLALENNQKIISCYEHYLSTGDEELFCDNLDKIASYYRIKEDLDEMKHLQQNTNKFGKRLSKNNPEKHRQRLDS
jgi:hypothetical protein